MSYAGAEDTRRRMQHIETLWDWTMFCFVEESMGGGEMLTNRKKSIACRACYTSYPGPAPIFPVMTGACSFFIHRLPKALKRCHAFTARADSTPASIDLIGLHSGDV